MFNWFKRNQRRRQQGARLYDLAAAAARNPDLFDRLGVPDTVDGRFDALVYHVFALYHGLDERDDPVARELQTTLQERMITDFDRSLREAGVGDLSVGKKVKAMAQAYRGRFEAYRDGLAGERDLREALARNLFRAESPDSAPCATELADYLQRATAAFSALPLERFEAGDIAFPAMDTETAA